MALPASQRGPCPGPRASCSPLGTSRARGSDSAALRATLSGRTGEKLFAFNDASDEMMLPPSDIPGQSRLQPLSGREATRSQALGITTRSLLGTTVLPAAGWGAAGVLVPVPFGYQGTTRQM